VNRTTLAGIRRATSLSDGLNFLLTRRVDRGQHRQCGRLQAPWSGSRGADAPHWAGTKRPRMLATVSPRRRGPGSGVWARGEESQACPIDDPAGRQRFERP
jgi:hypothetical protein